MRIIQITRDKFVYIYLLTAVLIMFLQITHGFFTVNRCMHCKILPSRDKTFRRWITTNIIVVGKRNGGEEWISKGYSEYEKRLLPTMNLQTTFLKSDDELIKAAQSAKGHIIALDEKGKQYTSVRFTDMLYSGFEKGGSTVTFIIGGFAGLPAEIRLKYPLISLSNLTWTHSMARLLLTEQIYRATEIRKGSSYHKE